MNDVVVLKTRVVMTREAYDEAITRGERYRRLSEQLRGDLEERQGLLILALFELAQERHVKDPQAFARRWVKGQRKLDMGGVPLGPL